jgi:hypothetical protein
MSHYLIYSSESRGRTLFEGEHCRLEIQPQLNAYPPIRGNPLAVL